MGTRVPFESKVAVREVDRSPPSSAEVRNEWSYASTPVCLHGVDGDKFTFTVKQGGKHVPILVCSSQSLQVRSL